MPTIDQAIDQYLQLKRGSDRTIAAYRNGLNAFRATLRQGRDAPAPAEPARREALDPETADVALLDESWMLELIQNLRNNAPATEGLYISAVSGFYRFLLAQKLANPFIPQLEYIVAERARKVGRRRPKFPREEIEKLIEYAEGLAAKSVEDVGDSLKTEASRLAERKRARLRNLRDRAFILLLADTGLRVSEAAALTIGDVDFLEGRLNVLSKGHHEDVVRVSNRALTAIKEYLAAQDLTARRQAPQGRARRAAGVQEKNLHIFIRHDRGAGAGDLRIAASTAWDFVRARAIEAAGEEAAAQIHPHSFRHYFVTVVLLATNNLEKARRMARHKNVTTTQLYVEIDPELDADYHAIFNG